MQSRPQAIGIAWYSESDYDTLRALFVDGEKLPRSFLQWQDQAEQLRKRYIRQGYIVVKTHIDPHTFPDWCANNGHNIDADARKAFANSQAHRIAVSRQT